MTKNLIAAAVLTIGLAGYAVAQEAAPAPALRREYDAPLRRIIIIIITITTITTTTTCT